MKTHVLVVDDSLTVRMDLRGALGAAGFVVTTCETKRAAQRALGERRFGVAVLDVLLPDGDGIDLLHEIRQSATLGGMPIIVLSSEAEVRDRVRGLVMGADDYVGKPYDISYVIRRVRALCERAVGSEGKAASTATCSGGRKILVVDDSPAFLQSAAGKLREDGHDVVLARSGREALELLVVQTVDAVVLDLAMPDLDGIETLRRLRRIPGLEAVPVVILTANEDARAQSDAYAAGADELLRRSVELDVLRSRIRNLLRKKPSHREGGAPVQAPLRREPLRAPHPGEGSLFARAAAATGLSGLLARDTLTKALRRAGVEPSTLSSAELLRAMPAIREALGIFYPQDEVARRAACVAALAGPAERARA
jgi:DNA-binding response OmpR family regulator